MMLLLRSGIKGKPEPSLCRRVPNHFWFRRNASVTKSSLSEPITNAYDPIQVEQYWYKWWNENGYFTPPVESTKKKFSMVLPPPNVTGSLHIGHALTVSLQDILIRWRRMNGDDTLYVPGLDHAGIATQAIVERKLAKEKNLTRHDLGRVEFIKKVWEWKTQYGGQINEQLQRTGASLDWTREVFTLDESRSEAVTEAFVKLHEDGLIYRGERLVNWCCNLQTVISDIEVDHLALEGTTFLDVPGYPRKVEFGTIWTFEFPILDDEGQPSLPGLKIATTRPETMLGDTAVAIHPDDKRYKKYHGKSVWHPLRKIGIPIVTDKQLVDMEIGTGVVKVTPAHDENDFECGKRHNLESITIMNDQGDILLEVSPEFHDLNRFEARTKIIEKMKSMHLFIGQKNNPMSIARCSRSGDILEPLLKHQWYVRNYASSHLSRYVNTQPLAEASIKLVRTNQMEILPETARQDWYRWLENNRDWCISRQLWWGHRIPAYRVKQIKGESKEEMWVVGRSHREALAKAVELYKVDPSAVYLEQDEDVLDTWFSSGLFPLSALGWPKKQSEVKRFYPLDVMETGSDILFFWVSRMSMLCTHLHGTPPFKTIYLHPMVRDAKGRKMSKSLGNVIDPIQVIEGRTFHQLLHTLKTGNVTRSELQTAEEIMQGEFPNGIPECGSDALRFSLAAYTQQGRSINLDLSRVHGYRKFCNKLWQVSRFILSHTKEADVQLTHKIPKNLRTEEKWILHRLAILVGMVDLNLKKFNFAQASDEVHNFILHDLCDVYVEQTKPVFWKRLNRSPEVLEAQAQVCREVLSIVLETVLRILHPFMPFISEELWQRLPKLEGHKESIMISSYPQLSEWKAFISPAVEQQMLSALAVIRASRALQVEFKVTKDKWMGRTIVCSDAKERKIFEEMKDYLTAYCMASSITILAAPTADLKDLPVRVINDKTRLYLETEGLNTNHLLKKKEEIEQKLQRMQEKEAEWDVTKIPKDVQEKRAENKRTLLKELDQIADSLGQ
ncbi:hypothetical protein PROFUN_03517 [Planoprotostelium fungivorum]|uniref:valine--tRNA ligase n=1 Tax=Planoprotostelium fungivorum TaxID=1890364 RepID=A0A2P6MNC7_9EUKA|nr:hypothetical protein PROFUN_03517 [Planoprotostelium fungivorum]